jgi:F-type H+-transporting ATPase subunit b
MIQNILADTHTWYTISFLILVYMIVTKGGPKILAAVDGRIAQIKSDIISAENLRVEAQEMLAQYQRKQRDAEKESEKIINDAKDAAAKIQASAEADIAEVYERREKQLQERLLRMQHDAIENIRSYAASLSLQAAEQLIMENLDKKNSANLLDHSIASIDRSVQ